MCTRTRTAPTHRRGHRRSPTAGWVIGDTDIKGARQRPTTPDSARQRPTDSAEAGTSIKSSESQTDSLTLRNAQTRSPQHKRPPDDRQPRSTRSTRADPYTHTPTSALTVIATVLRHRGPSDGTARVSVNLTARAHIPFLGLTSFVQPTFLSQASGTTRWSPPDRCTVDATRGHLKHVAGSVGYSILSVSARHSRGRSIVRWITGLQPTRPAHQSALLVALEEAYTPQESTM